MSSFRRATNRPGGPTTAGPSVRQYAVSTGLRELDDIMGGGQLLGSLTVLSGNAVLKRILYSY